MQAPVTAQITGAGSACQPTETRWARFASSPSRRSNIDSIGCSSARKLGKSRPEQKLGPSPESTTARTLGSPATSSIASEIAPNIAKVQRVVFVSACEPDTGDALADLN